MNETPWLSTNTNMSWGLIKQTIKNHLYPVTRDLLHFLAHNHTTSYYFYNIKGETLNSHNTDAATGNDIFHPDGVLTLLFFPVEITAFLSGNAEWPHISWALGEHSSESLL